MLRLRLPLLTRLPIAVLGTLAVVGLTALMFVIATPSCMSTVRVVFSVDGTSANVQCTKDLSNVVLKFCDGSPDYKYDNLSGTKQMTFSGGTKTLAGVWVKAGCNDSGDGPGYGEFIPKLCVSVTPNPTSTPTPTPTASVTPTVTPTATPTGTSTPRATPTVNPTPLITPTGRPTSTPTGTSTPTVTPTATPTGNPTLTPAPTATPDASIKICHIPNGVSSSAFTMAIQQKDLQMHLSHGDSLGDCPLDCMELPFGQAKIDLCGVCGGDNSSCKDCAGVPNGGAKVDACGVCNGNGETCKGCDGVANSNTVTDACGVCGGDGSTCKDCSGVPNGGGVLDQCGVCAGDNSTCKDCAGVPNGTSKIDACGVCGGDGLSCGGKTSECSGVVDRCGVCNGSDSCLDCAGIPNGGTKIDCCGICGGDGNSCPQLCKIYQLAGDKKKIRTSVQQLFKTISKHSKNEAKCNKRQAAAARKRLADAKALVNRTLSDLNAFVPDRLKVCDTPYCAKTSLKSVLDSVNGNLKRLLSLSKKAQTGDIKACGRGSKAVGSRASDKTFSGASSSLGRIPNALCGN